MNADLHMADDLKNTGKGNLFVIFGEPDIDINTVSSEDGSDDKIEVKINRRRCVSIRTQAKSAATEPKASPAGSSTPNYNEESFFRPPRLLPRRERPLQKPQNNPKSRNQRRRLGHLKQRHQPPVQEAQFG